MRILVVCSGNSGQVSPFIEEQVQQIKESGAEIQIFSIIGKGFLGYIKNLPKLKKSIQAFGPDLIHAHSGMSALLCGLQFKVPVVVTYHGSDINNATLRIFTRLSMFLTQKHIVVSAPMKQILKSKSVDVIPCGVNKHVFYPKSADLCRLQLQWEPDRIKVLFSSAFSNPVKNAPLALASIEAIDNEAFELIELKNKSREEVSVLMNAADVCLMTSFSEGSPQFIKEAMSCGVPIVSTSVGDINELLKGIEGCYITTYEVNDIADKLRKAVEFRKAIKFTKAPQRIIDLELSNKNVAEKVVEVYHSVISRRDEK
jgi:glycosyltransferase involved in cell wall biosynthesis